MTQEEKQLLLIDLCARLSYGVLFMVPDINEPVELLSINPKRDKPLEIDDGHDENSSTYWNLEDVTPYLRPMDSITDKEIDELKNLFPFPNGDLFVSPWNIQVFNSQRDFEIPYYLFKDVIDWLIAHYFDYYGLIPMGLALEAPEDMYKTE